MRTWTPRRWGAAALAILGAGLLLGLPTDLVPNPVFGRQIEAPTWAYPAWIVTSVLAGLLVATYVREHAPSRVPASVSSGDGAGSTGDDSDAAPGQPFGADEKRFTAGGLLAVFAIGCPTCNALVVLALGANGALAFFEPVQPFLAIAGIVLLGWALRRRLQSERACSVPPGR